MWCGTWGGTWGVSGRRHVAWQPSNSPYLQSCRGGAMSCCCAVYFGCRCIELLPLARRVQRPVCASSPATKPPQEDRLGLIPHPEHAARANELGRLPTQVALVHPLGTVDYQKGDCRVSGEVLVDRGQPGRLSRQRDPDLSDVATRAHAGTAPCCRVDAGAAAGSLPATSAVTAKAYPARSKRSRVSTPSLPNCMSRSLMSHGVGVGIHEPCRPPPIWSAPPPPRPFSLSTAAAPAQTLLLDGRALGCRAHGAGRAGALALAEGATAPGECPR